MVLLQTKEHVPDLGRLSPEAALRLGPAIAAIGGALVEVTGAAWTYCFGFTEAYRHIHLVPLARSPNVPAEYVRLAITAWPGAPRGDARRVAELSRRLRAAVSIASP